MGEMEEIDFFFFFLFVAYLSRSHLDSFDKLQPSWLDIGHVDNLAAVTAQFEKWEVSPLNSQWM